MSARSVLTISFIIGCGIGVASTQGEIPAGHHHQQGGGHHHHEFRPIGVMGDHMHEASTRMLSYRYMFMEMDGNRNKTDRLGTSDVLKDFRVTPTNMEMQMHMLGGMWAPTDHVTLMVMLPYVLMEMDHLTRMGGTFSTASEGFGDVKTMGLIRLYRKGHHAVHLNAGISFPTGSIDEKDDTPMGRVRLPYPMQLGSGTFDVLPGLTYLGHADALSWGAQALGIVRLGENDNDYTLGDRISGTLWGAYRWCEWFSNSLRVRAENWGNIDGADPRLDPTLVPTADPDRRGGSRVDLGIGAEIKGQSDWMEEHRLAVEWETPMYQDLDGPQLETDWVFTVGWQKLW